MRTTIDIPAPLRQKLVNEAVKKNLKGYSAIIVEALERYFSESETGNRSARLERLKGSLSEEEYTSTIETWKEGRNRWKM